MSDTPRTEMKCVRCGGFSSARTCWHCSNMPDAVTFAHCEMLKELLRYFVAFHTPGPMPERFQGGQMADRLKQARDIL